MVNIYVQVKFKLNDWIDISEWKALSDKIASDMQWTDWLIFRDSSIDEEWNVYCFLKWENLEKRTVFFNKMQKDFEENPEKMAFFSKIANMQTMEMKLMNVI